MNGFVQVGRCRHVGYWQGEPDECWPWLGSLDPAGYGQCWNPRLGRVDKAHRVVYEQRRGVALPPRRSGLELDHRCQEKPWRRCVNDAHLELVPLRLNRERRTRKYRPRAQLPR